MEQQAQVRSELRYVKAMQASIHNKLKRKIMTTKPELPAECRLIPGYSDSIKNQMTDEQRFLSYEERIKNWPIHAILIERNITIDEYLAEKMVGCRPISPGFKRSIKQQT